MHKFSSNLSGSVRVNTLSNPIIVRQLLILQYFSRRYFSTRISCCCEGRCWYRLVLSVLWPREREREMCERWVSRLILKSVRQPFSERSESAGVFADQSTVYDPSAQRHPVIEESSIEEPVPVLVEPVNQTLVFEIVEGGSERGKRKLIDSCGYSYNVKRQRVSATDWQCTVRKMVRIFCFGHLNQSPENVTFGVCELAILWIMIIQVPLTILPQKRLQTF